MPTKNPRINITLEPDTTKVLVVLAKQKHQSLSSLVRTLVLEALERHEDKMLSTLAETRDVKSTKTISHHVAWN